MFQIGKIPQNVFKKKKNQKKTRLISTILGTNSNNANIVLADKVRLGPISFCMEF